MYHQQHLTTPFPSPPSAHATTVPVFVPFHPGKTGTLREVRKVAAKYCALTRKATIARKLAQARSESSLDESTSLSSSASSDDSTQHQRTSKEHTEQQQRVAYIQTARPTGNDSQAFISATLACFLPHGTASPLAPHDFHLGLQGDRKCIMLEILQSSALFAAVDLWFAMGYHLDATKGNVGRDVLYVKHIAIWSVRDKVTAHGLGRGGVDSLPAAIALLAAWELRFGADEATFQAHFDAWSRLMSSRGMRLSDTCERQHLLSAADTVIDAAIHGVHRNLYDSTEMYQAQTNLPPGLERLCQIHTEVKFLAIIMQRILKFEVAAEDAAEEMRVLKLATTSWRPPKYTVDWRLLYALCHLRMLVIVFITLLSSSDHLRPCLDCDGAYAVSGDDGLLAFETHCRGARPLRPEDYELMIGTSYEELSFCALWGLCAGSGWRDVDTLRALEQMRTSLGLDTQRDTKALLLRYGYLEPYLDEPSKALFIDLRKATHIDGENG